MFWPMMMKLINWSESTFTSSLLASNQTTFSFSSSRVRGSELARCHFLPFHLLHFVADARTLASKLLSFSSFSLLLLAFLLKTKLGKVGACLEPFIINHREQSCTWK